MTVGLPTLVSRTAADACGITLQGLAARRDGDAAEARQLAAWLLSALTGWPVAKLGEAFQRDDQAMRSLLQRAHNRRRRDPIWKTKADRLLTKLRKVQNPSQEPAGQLELSLPGDMPGEHAWGFAGMHKRSYFVEQNERFAQAMRKAMQQERIGG